MKHLLSLVAWATRTTLLLLLHGYRFVISPMLPRSCRFAPSCSQYALEAVAKHGAITGLWLAIARLARCNPWTLGGVDPVPPARKADR